MNPLLKSFFINIGGELFLRQTNKTPRVVFWHGVDNISSKRVEAENITIENFKKQISYLTKKFEIISLEEFNNRFVNNSFTNKEVVITFDDGYKNNLTVVAPILGEMNIPFTVFISTNHISTGDLFPTSLIRLIIYGSGLKRIDIPTLKINRRISDANQQLLMVDELSKIVKKSPNKTVNALCNELIYNISNDKLIELKNKYQSLAPLNWDEVKKLKEFNCTIGSHCQDHFCCHDKQDKFETKEQIVESKKTIEEKLGVQCDYFAYPNGDFTDYSNECVKIAGYKMGFSTKKTKITNRNLQKQALPRLSAPSTIGTFKIYINLHPKK